jgi:hypothetical protein
VKHAWLKKETDEIWQQLQQQQPHYSNSKPKLGDPCYLGFPLVNRTCYFYQGPRYLQCCCLFDVVGFANLDKKPVGTQDSVVHQSEHQPNPFVNRQRDLLKVDTSSSDSPDPQVGPQHTPFLTSTASIPQGMRFVCLPSFFLIGTQKSGSTALFAYTLAHPQFIAPSSKEGHFFDRTPPRESAKFARSFGSYLGLFKSTRWSPENTSAALTGDATPSYILVCLGAEVSCLKVW